MNFGRSRVMVFATPVDMRRGYDGLFGLVRDSGADPITGDVFLFVSRDRTRTKALFWDGNGLNIWMKRMERGRFADVFTRETMTARELSLFFEGSQVVHQRLSPKDLTDEFMRPD
ncbi:MAG: IS66 family insertion sequence element accessory protein TnpB [Acidimicrobiales bacterium]